MRTNFIYTAVIGIFVIIMSIVSLFTFLMPKNVFLCIFCVGFSLLSSGIAGFVHYTRLKRSRSAYIESQDERNIRIFEKAASSALVFSSFALCIVIFIFSYLNYTIAVYIMSGLIVVIIVMFIIFRKYYQSKL